jgi:hypothetical protein
MPLKVKSAMLADAAVVADGKLYIHGGQWDTLATGTLPLRHPAMAIVLVVEVPYTDAQQSHQIELVLEFEGTELDAPTPVIGNLRTGHPAISDPGAPVFVSLAVPIQNLELQEAGRYDWRVKIDGAQVERIPMAVFVVPQPPGAPEKNKQSDSP